MPMLTHTKHHKCGQELEFMDRKSKIRVGMIYEVRITINNYHTHIIYCVRHEQEDLFVDGDTFREI